MDEFSERSLAGARFHRVDLAGASFDHVDLSGASFYEIDLTGVKIRGAYLRDVDIGGDLDGMRVNGVDVGPLIEAELDRRHPERAKLRPTDAAGFREAWDVIERLWAETVGGAQQLDPALLRRVVADLTDDQLDGSTEPMAGPGLPPSESFPVREVLATIVNEEWWHRQFGERDLAALTAPGGRP
jgi:uncharacterized protein YjbI with pentapeptide repeats